MVSALSLTWRLVAGVQVVPVQTKLVLKQSAFVVQAVLQAVAPQLYGEQETAVGVMQVAPAVQLDAAVNIVPVQEAARHCVPAA